MAYHTRFGVRRAQCHSTIILEEKVNSTIRLIVRWVSIFLIQIALTSCATGPVTYFHSFGFDTGVDAKVYGHPEIDVINYEYGSSGLFATRPAKEAWEMNAASGRDNFGAQGTSGMMPRGA